MLTPDHDLYMEECDLRNQDLAEIPATVGRGAVIANMPIGARYYRFRGDPLLDAYFPQWQADARLQAATFAPPAGAGLAPLPPVVLAPAVVQASGVPLAPAINQKDLIEVLGVRWVFAETVAGCVKGTHPVSLLGGLGFGDRGVLPPSRRRGSCSPTSSRQCS